MTPSDHKTKEFLQLYNIVQDILDNNTYTFNFETQDKELKEFITNNFKQNTQIIHKIQVDKNNFTFVYQKWLKEVKPTINVNWELVKKAGILDTDFFLADLLSYENESIKEKLFVVLKKTHYELNRKVDELTGLENASTTQFKDGQKAHKKFWSIYERPPKQEYWDFIVSRRDLLIPQDIRERKGSFFTPQIWVEKSQRYIADVLGEDWQEKYYIWDCAAGTGNLLNGLTNHPNVWASTLDKADVDVMQDRIANGWNMYADHVFQFDFLNDDFSKCPQELQDIINDSEKRKKLVIYINPPYAETDNRKSDRSGVKDNITEEKYREMLGNAGNELYAQFLIKIYKEMPNSIIAHFSKLKHLQSPNFKTFRKYFIPQIKKMFIVPAWTFDNVTGEYPIGFMLWDSTVEEKFDECKCNIYNAKSEFIGEKVILSYDEQKLMNDWVSTFKMKNRKDEDSIGLLNYTASDFQQQKYTALISGTTQMGHNSKVLVFKENLVVVCIYFTVRLCIEPTWLNDRDQFLYPNNQWETDKEFQSDCLIYTLFHGQNRISCEHGINHWIPFTPEQVGCKNSFQSYFMSDFLKRKIEIQDNTLFAENKSYGGIPLSEEAQAVYDSGLELWKYYHRQKDAIPNASFYDIRKHFQGMNAQGKMNLKSDDETYTRLIDKLRNYMKILAKKIEPKIYEYGFLK